MTTDAPRSPLVFAAAAAGYAALAVVEQQAGLAREGLPRGAGWMAAGLLVVLPFVAHALARGLGAIPARARPLVQGLQLVPLLVLSPAEPGLAAFALLVLVQGNLLVFAGRLHVAPWCLAVSPALVVAGVAVAPARAWLVLLPIGLALTLAGLFQAQTRLVAATGLRAAVGRRRHLVPTAPRTAPVLAVVLTGLVLACLPVLLGLFSVLPRPFVGTLVPREGWKGPTPVERDPEDAETIDASTAFDEIFGEGLALGRRDTSVLGEDVMEVRPFPEGPRGAARPLGFLYLRGVLLDTFHSGGMRYGDRTPLPVRRDADDGRRDGWTQLAGLDPDAASLLLEIVQQPLLVRGGTRSVLFGPERTVGIELPEVMHSPDGLLETPYVAPAGEEAPPWISYRLLVEERRAAALDLANARFAADRARDLQLPPPSPELETFAEIARGLTAGARTDAQRVEAVVGHFQRDFAYSIEERTPPGIAGLAQFMERRRGYCTYFATAAVLLLRTQGIPARVATGFLARDWSEEEECYLVTTRHAHAWIEVRYEGVGWVTYEPTPADGRGAAPGGEPRDPAAGLGPWAAELFHDLGRWLESGDEGWLTALGSTLAALPEALARTVRRRPALLLLLVPPVVWILLRRRSGGRERRAATAGGGRARPREGPLETLHKRLLVALARLGYHAQPPWTPREFAHRVRRRGGKDFAPLVPITEALYRARYGEREPTPEEVERARRFLERLSGRSRGDSPSGGSKTSPSGEPGL